MVIMELELPESLKAIVNKIGPPISSPELDTYRAISEISDKSHKLRTVLASWEGQQSEERRLRKVFAWALLVVLFLQILIINVTFFLIAYHSIEITPWVSNTFIISVFSEVVSMTFIVIRYLFPKVGMEFLSLIEKL